MLKTKRFRKRTAYRHSYTRHLKVYVKKSASACLTSALCTALCCPPWDLYGCAPSLESCSLLKQHEPLKEGCRTFCHQLRCSCQREDSGKSHQTHPGRQPLNHSGVTPQTQLAARSHRTGVQWGKEAKKSKFQILLF